MTFLHRLVSVLRGLFAQQRTEQELDRELEVFVAMSAEEKVRAGLSPEEARRQAVLELGGIEQAKEQVRMRRHGALLEEIGRDIRYTTRIFSQHPALTLVVILT